jgi:phosphatidylglycerol lysyltransferase
MDRRLFVADRGGKPVGFVVLTPVPSRNGWLTEQFVRGRSAPNGCIELTIVEAVRATCLSGGAFVTMGIVPLSDHGRAASTGNPPWLRLFLGWVRAHGRRFYNFEGLDRFKSKFHPQQWEPIYAISRERSFSPRTLYAIAGAFCQGSPMAAGARGLGRAARQEFRWLTSGNATQS